MRARRLLLCMMLVVMAGVFSTEVQVLAARKVVNRDGRIRCGAVSKAVPGHLNYQGYLADASDSSAVTATLEMTFRLFDAESGGGEQWSETHSAVEVNNGLFQVLLGNVTPFQDGLFDGTPFWLQTEVGGEILSPRKPLVSVAYSHRASSSEMLLDYTLGDLDDRWVNEGQANCITSDMIVDGEGSGLDADMVDGQHAADFIAMEELDHLDASDGDPAEAVYVDQAGKVGIGTASPLTELDVNGSVNATTYYGDGSHLTGIPVTSDGDWTIAGADMYSAISGNVGIGTSAPSGGKLHVEGSTGNYALVGNGNNGVYGQHQTGRYGYLGGQDLGVYGYSYTPPKMETGDGSKMVSYDGVRGECAGIQGAGVLGRHLSTGNIGSLGSQNYGVYGSADPYAGFFAGNVHIADSLGIGTTSPQEMLHVAGAMRCNDSIYVDGSSSYGVFVGPTVKEGLQVLSAGSGVGGYTISGADGIEVNRADASGLFVGSAGYDGILIYEAGVPSTSGGWGPTGTAFHAIQAQGCGLYVGRCDAEGVYVNSTGSDGVAVVEPDDSGLYVSTAGLHGVYVDSSLDDGIRVEGPGDDGLDVKRSVGDGVYVFDSGAYGVNVTTTGSHGVYVASATNDGVYVVNPGDDGITIFSPGGDGVYVYESVGNSGYFDLSSSSTNWAVYAHSTGASGNGIYCYGDGVCTGSWNHTVKTSKGWEAVGNLSSPDEEIMVSGTARLVNGRCRVEFEHLFSAAISHQLAVKIVLTPLDQWSGLYATERSPVGFTVLTGAGAQDVEFTWQAIGRRRGYEQRPMVNIPDPDAENARLAAEVEEAAERETLSPPHERLRSQRASDDARQHGEIKRVDPAAMVRRGE